MKGEYSIQVRETGQKTDLQCEPEGVKSHAILNGVQLKP